MAPMVGMAAVLTLLASRGRSCLSLVDGHLRWAPTRVDPWAGGPVVGKAAYSWREHTRVIIVAVPDRVEDDLARGALACPRCGGVLRPWAFAAARRVRQLDGSAWTVRPRRARCSACRCTQVLLPGSLLPRRADTVDVIGAALVARAGGHGWRRIAADLGRPPATVRRWLRAARGPHLAWLRRRGVEYAALLDREVLTELAAQPTELGDALVALAAAVVAWRRRFTRHAGAWTLIGVFTGGRLLTPT
jgi:transposase-like protein